MRKFRKFLVAGALALGLGACALVGSSPSVTMKAVASDVALIAQGLKAALPLLGPAGLSSDVLAKVDAAVGDIEALSSQVASTTTAQNMQPLVLEIETDVNTVVNAVNQVCSTGLAAQQKPASFSVGSACVYVQAAAALLPVIEVAVNLVVPAPKAAMTMSPDVARAVLHSAH